MEMIGKAHETAVLDTTVAWGEMGTGDPLILLHGILDSHRAWRRVAPLLAGRFRVLMPDLPGHGYSGRPHAPYTLPWFSKVIAAWMEEIGIAHANFCGHSYGGGIAQWMVLEERSRIDRLALVAPGGLGRGVAPAMRFATFPYLGPLLTPLVLRMALPAILRLAPSAFGHMEADEQKRFVAMTRIPDSDRAFQHTVGGVINFFGQYMQTVQRIGEVEQMPPVALFWGAKDPIIPVRHGRNTVADSDGVTLTTYKGCGHYPHLDVAEAFAHDLTEFLLDPDRPSVCFHPATRKSRW